MNDINQQQEQSEGPFQRAAHQVLDKIDPLSFGRSLAATAVGLARHPLSLLSAYQNFALNALGAAQAVASRMVGAKTSSPLAPGSKDKRFSDPAWEDNPLFYALLQAHFLRERFVGDLVDAADLDPQTARKARFAAQLMVDALAPTNYLWSNPAALRRALETGGGSLLRGLRLFGQDLRERGGWPKQVDTSSFQVGKNLAVSHGKVIYQNDLMELIQYSPQTPDVHEVPLLCSPPWINKYYIMDLAPGRSFVEWAIQHGHTTFMISYRNPDDSMREVTLDDYLLRGPHQAVQIIREITKAPKVNIVGLCLGGTLTTMLLASLAETGEDWINCATLLNTLVDFGDPGPIGAFLDPKSVASISRRVERRGYLDAKEMAYTFSLLRANDLVFNYVAKNWLMGEEPPAFDILAWNGDSTRLPAKMYTSYLRGLYQENRLARSELTSAGKRLVLSKVNQDVYILAAVEDHIAPWRSSYKTTQLLAGKIKFVLSSSGHIAGIVNPPSKTAVHWTNPGLPADPEAWLLGATKHQQTWWEDWARWIGERAGTRRAPPTLGSKAYRPLSDAPGTYVLAK
jgi:polyhydroxyalkanoate synthase subunit PhaC